MGLMQMPGGRGDAAVDRQGLRSAHGSAVHPGSASHSVPVIFFGNSEDHFMGSYGEV